MTADVTIITDPKTGKEYVGWDALVEDLANGYVVAVRLTNVRETFTRVTGPFATKAEAQTVSKRLRAQLNRRPRGSLPRLISTHVEPLWKDLDFKGR